MIAEHEWAAFAALPGLGNHWQRPGWGPDTRRYYWFLTVDHAPKIAQLARRCQEPLEGDGFDIIPSDGLHITVCRVGDTPDITERTLADLASAARLRCGELPAFDLQAIPVTGSRGAVRMSLAPWEPLRALHRAVSTACREAGIGGPQPTHDFRPHLGVAYCNQETDAAAIRDTIAELRTLRPQQFTVNEVLLVELRRENRVYRWDVRHSIPLLSPTTPLGTAT
ncbi:2'-5' RNA ligase family protein [Streptomyces sp. RKAG337]|uniref:2'-5' RNA ligase family protein n=1 Tax=Streptomyces sp. RKAG337 TaxID=2893404 RepID=UPI002033B3C5|nr:2'-5' RNA ligase family protein [Streptomyces sp. RKAG337]MCM2428557.1 2'-5' RNA ligase family protein [Streptomyces sp. RKAG337]